jgi:subtilisin family serine protease
VTEGSTFHHIKNFAGTEQMMNNGEVAAQGAGADFQTLDSDTCLDGNGSPIYPPTVGVSKNAATALLALLADNDANPLTVAVNVPETDYIGLDKVNYDSASYDATSYVVGVAAIVWAANPGCTNAEIRTALRASAADLGTAGTDASSGYGLVQAKAALDYLIANPCMGKGEVLVRSGVSADACYLCWLH